MLVLRETVPMESRAVRTRPARSGDSTMELRTPTIKSSNTFVALLGSQSRHSYVPRKGVVDTVAGESEYSSVTATHGGRVDAVTERESAPPTNLSSVVRHTDPRRIPTFGSTALRAGRPAGSIVRYLFPTLPKTSNDSGTKAPGGRSKSTMTGFRDDIILH
jgi:hypothetical protein